MNIALYMDVNVRAEITGQLRARDVDLLTSEKDGTREFSDTALLDRATALGRVLFTRDAAGPRHARERHISLRVEHFAEVVHETRACRIKPGNRLSVTIVQLRPRAERRYRRAG